MLQKPAKIGRKKIDMLPSSITMPVSNKLSLKALKLLKISTKHLNRAQINKADQRVVCRERVDFLTTNKQVSKMKTTSIF